MPWFEQLGGGTQYFFPAGIQDAVEKGCLRIVKG